MTVRELESNLCNGCSACADRCGAGAIEMKDCGNGYRIPVIDDERCLSCGLCFKVCPRLNDTEEISSPKTYVGEYKRKESAQKSSSGGIFYIMALHVIADLKGVVYGASMIYEHDKLDCRHIRVETLSELCMMQGSKYVQSKMDGIYRQVNTDLKAGRVVLFSGTSCQVAALKRFVGNRENLYTVDLVCHGIPKDILFEDYLKYIERKYHCRVIDVKFRTKGKIWHGKEMTYMLTLSCKDGERSFSLEIIQPKSAFYRLFITRAGYRDSCYNCDYAHINKPSDVTLGDFVPRKEELNDYDLDNSEHYSSIIVHTSKGEILLDAVSRDILKVEIPQCQMLSHHGNLQEPSRLSVGGRKLLSIYEKGGYEKLQSDVDLQYMKSDILYKIGTIIKRIKRITNSCQ